MTYGGIAANVAGTAYRYGLKVGGESYASRTDLKLSPLALSLQGPGGTSQLTFSVIQTSTNYTRIAPFYGGAEVLLYDNNLDPALIFKGLVVSTRSQRLAGTATRRIDVTAVGLDYYLDRRVIDSWKSRADTTGRNHRYNDDDFIVRRVMEKAGLNEMVEAGAYIDNTADDMDSMHFKAMTVRQCLDEIAEQAQPYGDYQTRRYYVDGLGYLHWYKGNEGLNNPPARIGDGSFYQAIAATSGIAAFYSGRVKADGVIKNELGTTNLDLNGGYSTGQDSLCYNHPEWPSVRLNGNTGYGSVSDAALHPGNTGTWGIVFKRASTGAAMALWSGGTDDILIGFDSSDHIRVQKEGTGDGFLSDSAYASTTQTYFLVVTHSAGNGFIVYLNGNAISGTATSRTLVAGSGNIIIGRKKSTSDQYYEGRFWGAWVSSSELSASAVTALAILWLTIVPDNLEVERDSTDITRHVWVKGGPAPGSGWVAFQGAPDPNMDPVSFKWLPEEVIDRPDTHVDGDSAATTRKRRKFGNAYMAAKVATTVNVTFNWTGDPSDIKIAGRDHIFRPGQTLIVTSGPDNLTNYETEIRQVDVDLELGNGVQTFHVSCGALPASALRSFRALMR